MMLPFNQSWPYERFGPDLYLNDCPFCKAEQVLLNLKPKALADIQGGRKTLLVLPCCHNRLTIIDVDNDSFLFDQVVRSAP